MTDKKLTIGATAAELSKVHKLWDEVDATLTLASAKTAEADAQRWVLAVRLHELNHIKKVPLARLADALDRQASTISQLSGVGQEFPDAESRFPGLNVDDHLALRRVPGPERPLVVDLAARNGTSVRTAVNHWLERKGEKADHPGGSKARKSPAERLANSVAIIHQQAGIVGVTVRDGEAALTNQEMSDLSESIKELSLLVKAAEIAAAGGGSKKVAKPPALGKGIPKRTPQPKVAAEVAAGMVELANVPAAKPKARRIVKSA